VIFMSFVFFLISIWLFLFWLVVCLVAYVVLSALVNKNGYYFFDKLLAKRYNSFGIMKKSCSVKFFLVKDVKLNGNHVWKK
ncbi:MAG: hypothetical protein ACKO96_31585, partial [Flammeovirgaceae bacterium]